MTRRSNLRPIMVVSAALLAFIALNGVARARPGGTPVPQPAKPVDLERYLGVWYEIGRYENSFERGCEGVTAEYRALADGRIEVINTCRQGGLGGPVRRAKGRAKVVSGSRGAKLAVTFFWPFFGDYWVLDHADDYAWSIVGEPSRRFLWLLSRTPDPPRETRDLLAARVREFGYDPGRVRPTRH